MVCGVFLCCGEARMIGWASVTVNRQNVGILLTGLEPFPSLLGSANILLTGLLVRVRKQGCKCGRKFRRFLQLLNQIGDINGGLRVYWRSHITQIRVGVEGRFKLLSVDLSVLIQNVCINSRDHVDLRMAGITLGCLQVAVIQLELKL